MSVGLSPNDKDTQNLITAVWDRNHVLGKNVFASRLCMQSWEQWLMLYSESPSSQQKSLQTLLKSLRTSRPHVTIILGNREQQNLQINATRHKQTKILIEIQAPTHWGCRDWGCRQQTKVSEFYIKICTKGK